MDACEQSSGHRLPSAEQQLRDRLAPPPADGHSCRTRSPCRPVSRRTMLTAVITVIVSFAGSCAASDGAVRHVRLSPGHSLSIQVQRRVRRSLNINDDIIGKLMRFGYLPQSDAETGELRDASHLRNAIRQFQKFANIPQTGTIDTRTKDQFQKPRCGLPDILPNNHRYKRYTLQGQKWDKTDLTWTIAKNTGSMQKTRVYHELNKAFKVWSSASVLTFTYVHSGDADIVIGFHKNYHQDGYPFDGKGQVLAHAFFPGTGRGGDAHFDEDEKWVVDEDNELDGVSLFAVAVHEFGHSLGLSHSSREDALMFPWYQSISKDAKLPDDDRLGLQQLYGQKPTEEGKTFAPNPHAPRPETTPPPTRRPRPEDRPDPCNTRYDAISEIRGEVFIFSGKYFWRINQYRATDKPVTIRISRFWYGLPKNLTKIDAIYERPHDHKIVIFIGRQYWVFSSNEPDPGYPQPITRLGLPDKVSQIDAAYVWGHNGKTYLFRKDMYWRLDESRSRVELDYPRDISVWEGVPVDIDSAVQYSGITYFFRGRQYWRFDDRRMRVHSRVPSLSAVKWMGCPLATAKSDELWSPDTASTSSSSHQLSSWRHAAATLMISLAAAKLKTLPMLFQ